MRHQVHVLWWLPLSPCQAVGEFIPSTVLSWLGPPQEHPAADDAVAGIIVQETGLPISLEKDSWIMPVSSPVYILPHCAVSQPLPPLSLVPCSSHASPAGGTAPPWRGTSASRSSWATETSFHQAWGFAENILLKVPMEVHNEKEKRAMFWGGRYICLDKEGCGGGHIWAGTWNMPDILGSTILVDFSFYLNKKLSALLIYDF